MYSAHAEIHCGTSEPLERRYRRLILLPIISVQAPVLNRFGQVFCTDARGVIQICDGARDFQDAIIEGTDIFGFIGRQD